MSSANGTELAEAGSSARVKITRHTLALIDQDHPVMTGNAQLCETCRLIEAREPHQRRLAEWAHLDITTQHPPDTAPEHGLVLATHPPTAGALTGRIELRLDNSPVATVTITYCPACRTAILDYIHVAAEY